MRLASWLRNLHSAGHSDRKARRGRRPARIRPAARYRPRFEVLEDRTVLSALGVTTPLDVVDANDGLLSLREAVIAANATPGMDTVILPAGTYNLTLAGTGEDLAATGDLDITDHLTIVGAGAGATVIDGGGLDRVFQVMNAKQVRISAVTIQGGAATFGGGIVSLDSTLTVENCIVSGNWAQSEGGGILATGTVSVEHSTISGNIADPSFNGVGGGIYAGRATLSVTDSTIANNSALHAGGIYAEGASLAVRDSTISGNRANGGHGGGVLMAGSMLAIDHSTIGENTSFLGGGIYAIESSLILNGCSITSNSATVGGGVQADISTLAFKDCVLVGNSASFIGGGLYAYVSDVTVVGSTISGNSAQNGGGIFNDNSTIHLKKTLVDEVFFLDEDYA